MVEINCPHCGRLNRPSAAFCAGCGRPLSAAVPPASPQPVQDTLASQPAQPARTPPTVHYSEDRPPPYPPPPADNSVGYANFGLHPPLYIPSGPVEPPADSPILRAASILSLVLFVILQAVLLPIFYLGWQALNPGVYKNALESQDFYTRAPLLVAEQLEYSKYVGNNLLCEPLTKDDWSQITTRLAPTAWLQDQAESAIDQFFTQARTGQADIRLSFSLAAFNQAVGGGPGFEAYQEVFRDKAVCSEADMDRVYGYLLETPGSCIPRCKLPPDLLDRELPPEIELIAFLWESTDDAIQFLLEIAAEFLPQSREMIIQSDSGGFIALLRLTGLIYPIAGLLALLTLSLLLGAFFTRRGRTLGGWLTGWGVPLASAGAICLLIALAVVIGGPLLLAGGINGAGSEIAPGLSAAIQEITGAALFSMALPLGLHAAVLLIFGGLMAGIGLLLRR